MKKLIFIIIIAILGFAVLFFYKNKSYESTISKEIQISLPKAENVIFKDSHGGFHGDGKTFAKLRFSQENGISIKQQIENNSEWNVLPLSKNLGIFFENNRELPDEIFNYDDILNIKNGYWYFYDRHDESTDRYSDSELLTRFSYNFNMAIYDADNDILYYFELDT